MIKILITGANGFTGQHLQKFLRGVFHGEIIALDLNMPKNTTGIRADLLSRSQLFAIMKKVRPDYVIHLAGIAKSDNYEDIYKSNAFTTINLLEALLQNDLNNTRVLLISSSAVYGNSIASWVDETTPLNPVNHYGNSKLLVEKIAGQYLHKFNLKIVTVRPFNLFGPGQGEDYIIATFLAQLIRIKKGQKPPVINVGDLSGNRDFIFIDDAVRAYWTVLTQGQVGEVYNIGSGKAISIKEVLEKLMKLTGVECRIQVDDRRIQRFQIQSMHSNNAKITALGWRNETSFEAGLQMTVNEYLQAGE
jgi:GDP-4-dehydro-6-deoxy-D-mannose reductase